MPAANIPSGESSGVPEKRPWMTAEEFLAQIEANRIRVLKERAAPKKPGGPRVIARVYALNPDLKYIPKPKSKLTPEVSDE